MWRKTMMNDDPKKLSEQAYNDLSPEDKAFLEKVVKDNKEFLEKLKNDGPFGNI